MASVGALTLLRLDAVTAVCKIWETDFEMEREIEMEAGRDRERGSETETAKEIERV